MQVIPQVFKDKVRIDSVLSDLRSHDTIPFAEASATVKEQRVLRRKCQIALAMHKVDQDGPGSPVAMVG